MASLSRFLWSTLPLRENYFKSPEQVGTALDPNKSRGAQNEAQDYDVIIIGVSEINLCAVWIYTYRR